MSLRVLIACEFSGIIRDAFTAAGHEAWSCDVLPSERPGLHYQDDVRHVLTKGWDLMIAHPPCRYLALSGNRWRKGQEAEVTAALDFAEGLWNAPIAQIAIEQPRSVLSRRIGKHTQTIHPYEFGIPEFKTTWLWLKGLPPLIKTLFMVPPELGTKAHDNWSRVHRAAPGPGRMKERSRSYPEIAAAIAAQWGATIYCRNCLNELSDADIRFKYLVCEECAA